MSRKTRPPSNKASGLRLPKASPTRNAQHNYERYLALARAQEVAGDRVAAENFFQHAEHYLRAMREGSEAARGARR